MLQSSLNRSRNDKYLLIIDIPKALKNKYDNVFDGKFLVDPLQITIYGSPVPDIRIPDMDIPYSGQIYKASSLSRPAYNPLTIKFLIDNSYYNYWLIWNWLNLFNDYKDGSSELTHATNVPILRDEMPNIVSPMSDFTSRFSIFGLDEYNNKIISFNYKDVFPTSLSEIIFSNQEGNEITCNATFSFNQLHIDMLINNNSRNC
jgi:hypothetical protein